VVYLDALSWNLKQILRPHLLQLFRGRWACGVAYFATFRPKSADTICLTR
jgi:hypothetical protein